MKKLISFDVDMTLLDHADYNIPKSALKAVELLKKAGNIALCAADTDSCGELRHSPRLPLQ